MSVNLVSSIIAGIMIGGVYSLIALGNVVIYKSSKVVSLSQGGLLLMGALIGWVLLDLAKFPPVLAMVLTPLLCAFIGLAVERFALRPVIGQPLLSAIMITIALAWFFDSIGVLIIGGGGRAYPPVLPSGSISFLGLSISEAHLLSFVIAIILYIAFTIFYQYSKLGLAMRGTAEDHEVIQSLGIKVTSIFSQTWLIAGLTAGIGGFLMASMLNVYVGLSSLGWKALAVIIIGGLDSILGAIIVGPLIGILESLSTLYLDPLVGGGTREIAPFIIMLLVLFIRPYGLFGLKRIERI